MKAIYFDNAATTRINVEVAKLAASVMFEDYGNPSSLHEMGFNASQLLTKSRNQVANLLGAKPEEIIFTSGGTEANNLAIIGATRARRRSGNRIVTSKSEHSSVKNCIASLIESGDYEGYEVRPNADGDINFSSIEKLIDSNTTFVSFGMVNSELGSIANIRKLVSTVKSLNPKTLVHADAVQAFGKIPFNVNTLGVDLLSVSGHKLYAPKGVGALYVRKGVRILPIMYGGSQEDRLRPGTENMPAICGFGYAAELASKNMKENYNHAVKLQKRFLAIAESASGVNINSYEDSSPYICNISVPGYRSETLLHYMADKNIYVSSGSACAKGKRSYVLEAAGLNNQRIDSALRISFNNENTIEEIDTFFETLAQARRDLIRS